MKHAFSHYTFTAWDMSDALMIPVHLVEKFIEYLMQQKFVDVSPKDILQPSPGQMYRESL